MQNLEIENWKLKINPASGFTLLMSLLIMSAILVTGLGVADIILREIKVSNIGRESQIAFYAADTGAECALFWDVQKGELSVEDPSDISCAGLNLSDIGGSPTFSFSFSLANGSCARVDVDYSDPEQKVVQAHGFNMNCASDDLNKVERVLEVRY